MSTKEKNLEEEYSEEDILEVKNFQEMIKNLTKSHGKNWVWFSIIVNTIFIWIMFVTGIFRSLNAILLTIFIPLMIFSYYARKSKHKIFFNKIMLVGCAGYVITAVIWLFAGYILFNAPWAPFYHFYHKLSDIPQAAILLILMGAIYGIVAYILYRFGKKREWKIFHYY